MRIGRVVRAETGRARREPACPPERAGELAQAGQQAHDRDRREPAAPGGPAPEARARRARAGSSGRRGRARGPRPPHAAALGGSGPGATTELPWKCAAEEVGPDELDQPDRLEAEREDVVRPLPRRPAALRGELEDRQQLHRRRARPPATAAPIRPASIVPSGDRQPSAPPAGQRDQPRARPRRTRPPAAPTASTAAPAPACRASVAGRNAGSHAPRSRRRRHPDDDQDTIATAADRQPERPRPGLRAASRPTSDRAERIAPRAEAQDVRRLAGRRRGSASPARRPARSGPAAAPAGASGRPRGSPSGSQAAPTRKMMLQYWNRIGAPNA